MHSTSLPKPFYVRQLTSVVAVYLLLFGAAQAQTPAAQTPAPAASASTRSTPEQRSENIRIEDAGNRIDEVRIGGETRSITVQPKGGMPSYQVAPATGERRWKVLGF